VINYYVEILIQQCVTGETLPPESSADVIITHSLFFSFINVCPFLINSSVTCFFLGKGDKTAQCCKIFNNPFVGYITRNSKTQMDNIY